MRISFKAAAVLFLIMLSFICCSRGDHAVARDSKVIVGYYGDERIFFHDYWGMEAAYLMFLPLAESMYGYIEPKPALAERWEHSEDYREWTFYLRKDARWHDGVPVTAHDIKFTIDLRRELNLGAGSAEIVDDYVCRITYENPKNALNGDEVYYPKHLLEDQDPKEFYDWEFWTHPVGNGPYRYVRHVPQTMVEIEANPDYYRGKPKIDRVILKFIKEPLTELMSGDVDAVSDISRLDLLAIENDSRYRSYYGWGNTFTAVYWNHGHSLFQSPVIRRALTMAINRAELARVLNYPGGVPVKDTITTIRQFLKGDYPDPLPYDPVQSRNILVEQGWKDEDGDGIREREDREFRFTVLTSSSLPGANESCIYIQDQLRRIGVRMEIQTLEANPLKQRIRSGDFEALLFLVHGSTNQPNFGDVRLFGKESPLGYRNPEMIRLLDLAKLEVDSGKLDGIYTKIMPIFIADMPVTFLLPQVFTSVAHKRIQGLINQYRIDPVWGMEHLWIGEEK